jgi:hypothetical protein
MNAATETQENIEKALRREIEGLQNLVRRQQQPIEEQLVPQTANISDNNSSYPNFKLIDFLDGFKLVVIYLQCNYSSGK